MRLILFICMSRTGAVRRDVLPGGSGLGKRFRGDVRQGQHKRRGSVQGTFKPSKDEVQPRPVPAAKLGPETVVAVRRRPVGTGVDGAHTGATRAPAEKSQRQQRRLRRRRRWKR